MGNTLPLRLRVAHTYRVHTPYCIKPIKDAVEEQMNNQKWSYDFWNAMNEGMERIEEIEREIGIHANHYGIDYV